MARTLFEEFLKTRVMRTDTVRHWNNKKGKLLRKYNNLTDKDLRFNLGNEKEMIETLGSKLGKSMKELLSIIITL
jgi:hypothetical protein